MRSTFGNLQGEDTNFVREVNQDPFFSQNVKAQGLISHVFPVTEAAIKTS